MYEVDHRDIVEELKDFPQSSVGAPIPMVIANELGLVVLYYLELHDPGWDGSYIQMVDEHTVQPVAIVRFNRVCAHYFGHPNDEAFSGHPLAARGLKPYGNFEILNSSWIRKLEQMNAVHPYHNKDDFMKIFRHFILSFHDNTFECIASNYDITIQTGSIKDIAGTIINS